MGRALYICDLDGTLLNNNARMSDFTRKTLDSLISNGLLLTYATARSYVSASAVLDGFEPRIPSIIYNGTFIRNNDTGEQILLDSFDKAEAKKILDLLMSRGVYPLTYAYIDGKEKYSYATDKLSEGVSEFVTEHQGDIRDNPSTSGELDRGEIFHFTCIDDKTVLFSLYEELKDKYQCVFYKEQYSGRFWLEIHPVSATKANAIKRLKEMLGADKIICFGDGENDILMFDIADECYAPENAVDKIKCRATAVIGSNEDDGVAKWLLENAIFERD